jgi:hypothetical protein
MIAIYIHEVEVFVRKLYGHLVRKATMYLNLPTLGSRAGIAAKHEDTGYPIQFGRPSPYLRSKLRRILFLSDIATGQSECMFLGLSIAYLVPSA